MSRPLVSIVIPFYNRVDLLHRALESVFSQTYTAYEVVVVNDGSAEDDSSLTRLFSGRTNLTYIKLEKNAGPAQARNTGIAAAKGEYIAFLDSDDTWEAAKLDIQMDQMLKNGWAFSHTSYVRHDMASGRKKEIRSGSHHYAFPFPAFHCRIATPSVIVNRNLLNGLSFRSDLRFAEDTMLWLGLSRRTVLHGIDQPLVNVYTGESTAARNHVIRQSALQVLGKEGLAGHPLLSAVHFVYRIARKIQIETHRIITK